MSGAMKVGDYVIMNDADRPETRMVAVLERREGGTWHARYLYPDRKSVFFPYGPEPTPLSDFGKALEWRGNEYRVIDTGGAVVARYRDGVPRGWQDPHSPYWVKSRMPTPSPSHGASDTKGETI